MPTGEEDTVFGNGGNDTLIGGTGVDVLIGGGGNDSMNGGAGDDVYVFCSGFGNDTIAAFDAAPGAANSQDRIDVSSFGITAATFATRVAVGIVGVDTRVGIDGADSILLLGVTGTDAGVNANAISLGDFLL